MNTIKKFSVLIVLLIMLTIESICSAQRISVCDFSVDNFCEKYNYIVGLSADKNRILIEKTNMHKSNVNSGLLLFYPLRNCVNGNGTYIAFFTNPANNIYEINITNNTNATKEDTTYAYITVLKVLGLSQEDIHFFLDLSEPKYKPISEKRTLLVGFRPAGPGVGFDEFKIAAFTN